MTSYSASVGSTPVVISGTLQWNANGTLKQNTIVDGYNAADTQACSYQYDDFVRVAGTVGGTPGVNCVNGSTAIWNQTFTYGSDSFGNLTKHTTGPGLTWNPGYNSANNQYTLAGTTYDADGNLKTDTFHTYTWNPDGHVATIDSATITYDADGNKVEENVGGLIREYVSGFGVTAQMMGQIDDVTTVALPGGVQALYAGGVHPTVLQCFRYPDWEGTIRAESNPNTRVFTESLAFAPFGERYGLKGAPFNVDSFTGSPDQIVSDEYDFLAREEHNGQGRWISPDPARGTGNKYVYADNNPLSKVDPYGLLAIDVGFQLWFDSEMNRGDPLEESESHPPQSVQTPGIAESEIAYLDRVDEAFAATPQDQQKSQAKEEANKGQPEAQNQMSLSSKGLDFIKKYEKLSLTTYKDQAGYETIGYGHKILPGEDFSKGITKAQALDLLSHDAQGAVNAVNAALKVSVKQNQFDALVSLAFNAGPVSVKSSNQMMRAVNAGNVTEENFTAYRFVHVNGQAVVSQGLLRRREDEYSMYSEGKY